jgi:hypothetical protein
MYEDTKTATTTPSTLHNSHSGANRVLFIYLTLCYAAQRAGTAFFPLYIYIYI